MPLHKFIMTGFFLFKERIYLLNMDVCTHVHRLQKHAHTYNGEMVTHIDVSESENLKCYFQGSSLPTYFYNLIQNGIQSHFKAFSL